MTRPNPRQRQHLASWLEGGQDGGYILPESIEHWDNWSQFARDYLAGKAGWEFHVGIRPRDMDWYSKYFVVQTRVAGEVEVKGGLNLAQGVEAEQGLTVPVDWSVREIAGQHSLNKEVQAPVLVYIGKLDEFGKRVEFSFLTPVASVIRLKAFQPVEMGPPNVFEETMTGDLFQLSDIGKLDLLRLGFGRQSPEVHDSELIHEVIKRGPEVLNGVPEDQRPLVIDLYESVGAINNSPLWWLILPPKGNRNGVRICCLPNVADITAKGVNMGFRPVKLGPRTRQIKTASHG